VGMASVRKPNFSFYDFMISRPWLSKLIAKVGAFIHLPTS